MYPELVLLAFCNLAFAVNLVWWECWYSASKSVD